VEGEGTTFFFTLNANESENRTGRRGQS
jgi:hypothetical protein